MTVTKVNKTLIYRHDVINKQIEQIKKTLHDQNVDFNHDSANKVVEKRNSGGRFSFNEHLRGLVHSLLSGNRPWEKIEKNLDKIDKIFHNYDPAYLKVADNLDFIRHQILEIKCGNRSMNHWIEALPYNIGVFYKIEAKYKSLDAFVSGKGGTPYEVAQKLSNSKEFKLQGVGDALASEYLRNVGINIDKPDIHIRRLIGPKRLGFIIDGKEPNVKQTHEIMKRVSKEVKMSASSLDTLLWLLGSKICAKPSLCGKCLVDECEGKERVATGKVGK